MFQLKTNHVCAIEDPRSKSFLPDLPPDPNTAERLLRYMKKFILVTERNPQSLEFFRSTAEIIAERKKQVQENTWIIHPFSTFRLYYEMWMAFVFFICLFYIPLYAAYRPVMINHETFDLILNLCCIVDIIITFRTGYPCTKKQEIVMKPSKIAKHYIQGIYFTADVLSSIPDIFSVNVRTNEIINYLAMFKILRSKTLLNYANRTFYFFKIHGLVYQTLKTIIVIFLLNHYFACVVIIDMLKAGNSLENKYYAMMSQVNAYMTAKNIPKLTQRRMREYYRYKYRQKYFKESRITKFLSENLRREINYHSCRKLVQGVKIFGNIPQKITEDILTHLKVEIYLTGDVIIQAGSQGDCMYFIESGTVKVSSPSGKEICHLEDGAFFGEIALVTVGQKRTANIVAIEICELYKLDRKSFKKCMEQNKELYKKIQQEAKTRLIQTQNIESSFKREVTGKFSVF
ncbi:potassium/sodium hyperpolarization-activated cyclic nucleotide-gated channel 4-like [Asbolus verrucosus]|uniref:Potassium/sodium hyperpolarization-activated cyclic nucleotide-gated channel 4-like n=1 Tax=Asbolus verrucosus TaxID=1661398 RepID=A0A482V8Q3_ASBVE|nr:potassium/sodium hyperpolarization-activated cyclic nucleotide-gated channel 4-like [Asbolus verrucosus]